jgi:ATP-binding cassette subfamily B protein
VNIEDAPVIVARPSLGGELEKEYKRVAQKRPAATSPRAWGLVWRVVGKHKALAGLTAICTLLAIAMQLLLTWTLRNLVDDGLRAGTEAALWRAEVVVGLCVMAFALFSGLRVYLAEGLGARIVTELRQRVFAQVLDLDAAFFLRTPVSEVIARMTADMTIVEMVTGNAAHIALRSLLILLGALGTLIWVSHYLALLMLLALVLAMLPLVFFASRVRRLSRVAQDRFAAAMVPVSESLGAIETVQAFGRERTAAGHFVEASRAALRAALARIRAKALTNGLLILFTLGGLLILFYKGAAQGGGNSYGELTQMLLLALMAGAAVRDLGNVWGDVQQAGGALERIGELLSARPVLTVAAQPRPVPADGDIRFDRVDFAYPGHEQHFALQDFTLHVRRGERVALVGPSGSGKSTVFRLLLRFYDPVGGAISIGETDLREADPAELRALFAQVDQDAALFSWSVGENIGFGLHGATDVQVSQAAEAAQAAGFVRRLPAGLATPLGARGNTLSGGQRQRIAIARALVRDAPFLLLDEATSALDAENEKLIQEALQQAMSGRTTLVIAHRLSTVKEADRIVVLDDGRIVEEGTHANLMALDGLYARVARLQFRD